LFYNVINNAGAISATNLTKGITTENVRGAATEVLTPLEEQVVKFFQGDATWDSVAATLAGATDALVKIGGDLTKGGANVLLKTSTDIINTFTKEYSSVGVNPTQITFDPNNPVLTSLTSFMDQLTKGTPVETKTQVSGEVKHTVEFGGTGMSAQEEAAWNKYMDKFLQDPNKKAAYEKWVSSSNEGLLTKK
jgi:hypothetical protein